MKANRFQILLYLALIALSTEVVLLVMQNRRLQANIVAFRNSREPETLKIGEKVKAIDLLSLTGELDGMTFGANAPNRLLFIFSTRCPACKQTLPVWKKLTTALPATVNSLGITSDSVSAAITYHQLQNPSYPVFIVPDSLFKRYYKISVVPQTVLLDSSGTVRGVWLGVLQDHQIEQIQNIMQRL